MAQACGGAEAERVHGSDEHGHGMHHPEGHHEHDFSDPEAFVPMFEGPERDAWQRPGDVVALLELAPRTTVVDLGAGTGYFLPHLARANEGVRVIALDVEAAMVEHMRRRIAREGLSNVEARVCATDDPGLEEASVDRILIVNTWHHISDREAYAAKLQRALRPGGFVLVVDFTREAEHGPPPEMRLSPEAVIAELEAGGLDGSLASESLPDQYVVRAAR